MGFTEVGEEEKDIEGCGVDCSCHLVNHMRGGLLGFLRIQRLVATEKEWRLLYHELLCNSRRRLVKHNSLDLSPEATCQTLGIHNQRL